MHALPRILVLCSLLFLAMLYGGLAAVYAIPPAPAIATGLKTLYALVAEYRAPPYFGEFPGAPDFRTGSRGPDGRWQAVEAGSGPAAPVLVTGGLNAFREHCPESGCLAVLYGADGAVRHAYPYRPRAIFAADRVAERFPRETLRSDPAELIRPIGLQRYQDGDLLVAFQIVLGAYAFPYAAGLARVGPDGHPRWFRFDYSHHWPRLTGTGAAFVPTLEIDPDGLELIVGPVPRTLDCATGPAIVDAIHVIGPEGTVRRKIDLAAALGDSPWSALLVQTSNECNPLHLNGIDIVGRDAKPPLAPGDLLVSLRNPNLLATLDPESGRITGVHRGTFVQQHAARHLGGSRVLLFDNWGGDATGGPSRIVEVDLATGAERRVFPLSDTGAPLSAAYSNKAGHLDLSPDRRRALISVSEHGIGAEIEIASGRVLRTFENVHDLSGVPAAPAAARAQPIRAQLFGLYYAGE